MNQRIFSAEQWCSQYRPNFPKLRDKVTACPTLRSLRSVNEALAKLVAQSNSPVADIAAVITRDPSLTARLLRLVNSVYSGLSVKITSVEEAIFFLGLRQIRQMAITTRVINDIESLQGESWEVDWTKLWRHSIATGILSREILSMTPRAIEGDTYYIVGLLHNVGKMVMAHAFHDEFRESLQFREETVAGHFQRERERFGWTHADLGALYLERHGIEADIVKAVLFHHDPENAPDDGTLAAGVQIADQLARYGGCDSGVETVAPIAFGDWEKLSGWGVLFGGGTSSENQMARAAVLNSIERLESLLEGLLESAS